MIHRTIARTCGYASKQNGAFCLYVKSSVQIPQLQTHKDEFEIAGEVKKISWRYKEYNSGICHCGKRIDLFNQYQGACECPYCGQWWNIWGQELKDVSEWKEYDDSYDDEFGEMW